MRGRIFAALAAALLGGPHSGAAAMQAAGFDQGENFTEARPVVVRVTQRGGLAFPGGEIDFSASRPGWDPYQLKADWNQSSTDGSRKFEICGDRGETLFLGRSVWSQRKDGAVVGRVVIECVSAVEMQCLAVHASVPVEPSFGLGDGIAADFDLPLSDGRTVRLSFPEPVHYHSQDSRPWFGQWSVRLGGHLGHGSSSGTRKFSPGERLVWDMVVSAPDGLALDLARPLDIAEGENWARLDYKKDIVPGSALDFSTMGLTDAPAGKHGWLKAVGGHFEFEGLLGVGQRFYGANLCFSANYLDHDLADLLVDRFVRFGYNSVRIHHHDEAWAAAYACRELPVAVSGGSGGIAPRPFGDGIDRLDYLLARCFERGIYATTDLYVSRPVMWREIGIDRDGDMPRNLYKTYIGCHDGAFSNWCHWAQAFLEHVNPYTGRAYKDEPGLPLISLINEGRLAEGWAAADKAHDPVIREAWRAFCASAGAGAESPSLAEAPPQDSPLHDRFDDYLNRRIWERCTAFLRSLGCRALLTNDNSGRRHGEGEANNQLLDYVDCHSYVDHPVFLEQPWRLPFKCGNSNPVRDGKPAVFYRGWADGASKPYVLTEWNFSGPGRYRGMGGVLVGALAAEHGWDGLWRFAYSHDRRGIPDGGRGGSLNFDIAEDPLMAASDRASVCLYLRGDSAQIQTNAQCTMHNAQLESALRLDKGRGSFALVTPRTCGGFAEEGRVEAGPLSFEIVGSRLPAVGRRLSNAGKQSADIRQPTAEDLQPSGLSTFQPFNLSTDGGGNHVATTLWASSLDSEPLERSSRILLAHLTDVQGEGARYADASRTIMLKWGRAPLVEAGAADVTLRLAGGSGAEPPSVWALDMAGNRISEVPASWEPAAGEDARCGTAHSGVLRFRVCTAGAEGGRIYYEIVTPLPQR